MRPICELCTSGLIYNFEAKPGAIIAGYKCGENYIAPVGSLCTKKERRNDIMEIKVYCRNCGEDLDAAFNAVGGLSIEPCNNCRKTEVEEQRDCFPIDDDYKRIQACAELAYCTVLNVMLKGQKKGKRGWEDWDWQDHLGRSKDHLHNVIGSIGNEYLEHSLTRNAMALYCKEKQCQNNTDQE